MSALAGNWPCENYDPGQNKQKIDLGKNDCYIGISYADTTLCISKSYIE